MLERAIAELEAYRDSLVEQAVKVDEMLATLKNGVVVEPSVIEVKRQHKTTDEIKDLVLQELEMHDKPMTNMQLARALSRGNSTMSNATHTLLNEGKIEIVGKQGHRYLYALKK